MASIFDGIGTLTTGLFGDVVSVTPDGGLAREIQAVFRETPAPVLTDEGGEIMTVVPTLIAVAGDVADLVPYGIVRPDNGKVYRVIDKVPSGSPADDATMILRLEWTGASS